MTLLVAPESRIYKEYIRRLERVNDETVPETEHYLRCAELDAWIKGVRHGAGQDLFFNGDYYYLDKAAAGEIHERPMCCGVFLDWEYKGDAE